MNINKLASLAITASLLILFQTSSLAGVYKWVDENGQVHYGEQPVGSGAERVTIRKNTTTKPRAIKKDDESADAKNTDGSTAESTEQKTETKEVEISKKEKRKLCNEARSDVAAINSRGRLREINAKGEYSYLSDKQKQQRLSAAMKKQRQYCR